MSQFVNGKTKKPEGFRIETSPLGTPLVTPCWGYLRCEGCCKPAHGTELEANDCLIRMLEGRIAVFQQELKHARAKKAELSQ